MKRIGTRLPFATKETIKTFRQLNKEFPTLDERHPNYEQRKQELYHLYFEESKKKRIIKEEEEIIIFKRDYSPTIFFYDPCGSVFNGTIIPKEWFPEIHNEREKQFIVTDFPF